MWKLVVGHMEKMLKHMESMGRGTGGTGHGMMRKQAAGDIPSSPPAEKKPE